MSTVYLMKTLVISYLFIGFLSSTAFSETAQAKAVCYSIPKMHCNGCVERISEEIEGVKGVQSTTIDLETRFATIVVDSGFEDLKSLSAAIENAGYESSKQACPQPSKTQDSKATKQPAKKKPS
jgi:copper chaperone CopZ